MSGLRRGAGLVLLPLPKSGSRPIKRNAWILLGLALALRCGVAVVDEIRPIFPPHHYTDAQLYDQGARDITRAWAEGTPPKAMSSGRELYSISTAILYRCFGARPLVPKIINALIGTASLWLWYLIAALLLPPAAALWSLGLLAFWPSHVFYTSQNLRESATLFFLAGTYYPFLKSWQRSDAGLRRPDQALLAAGFSAMFLLGFFRSHLILFVCAGLLFGTLIFLRQQVKNRQPWGSRAVALALLLTVAVLFQPMAALIKPYLYTTPEENNSILPADIRAMAASTKPYLHTTPEGNTSLLPADIRVLAKAQSAGFVSPYSPQGLSEYRLARHGRSQLWSKLEMGRSIQTQIFPKAEFKTWFDVLLFLPKATFYTLFMPLPGLYPTGGKLGRIMSSFENLGLLLLFVLALLGFRRHEKTPAAWSLVVFFCLIVPPSALLEFDLGSAVRHRLQIFPFIFPFAALFIEQWVSGPGARWLRSIKNGIPTLR